VNRCFVGEQKPAQEQLGRDFMEPHVRMKRETDGKEKTEAHRMCGDNPKTSDDHSSYIFVAV
jgi:hypothetical protein